MHGYHLSFLSDDALSHALSVALRVAARKIAGRPSHPVCGVDTRGVPSAVFSILFEYVRRQS